MVSDSSKDCGTGAIVRHYEERWREEGQLKFFSYTDLTANHTRHVQKP